ncbi:MAG: MerR family transcriptional regulator [Epsilonproteobacteria bacterium]|nr:MerR family transcriptional regulator [Campylobacterota bacterium]
MHGYDEPVYLISVVSKVLSIHPQTLRQYEREGLITPSRTEGRMRLYSQKDMDKIRMILRLTRDLGVNLAGVDIVLQFKEQIDELENEIEELKNELATLKKQGTIDKSKSLIKKRHAYDIILFGE